MLNPHQLERIFEIDQQIRAGQYPRAEDIAAKLKCSRRIIFSDKQYMTEHMDAPIEFDREKKGWYYADPAWVLPGFIFTQHKLPPFLFANRHWFVFSFDKSGRTNEDGPSPETYIPRAAVLADDEAEQNSQPQQVAIHFNETEVRRVRAWRWPEDYEQEHLADGSLILRFESNALKSVAHWVMQFGDRVRVLRPRSLQTEVAEAHRRAWEQYESISRKTNPVKKLGW